MKRRFAKAPIVIVDKSAQKFIARFD